MILIVLLDFASCQGSGPRGRIGGGRGFASGTPILPGYPRVKEWAYAGFTFDLVGAIYAGLAAGDPIAQQLPIFVGLVFVFGSYIFYHKKMKGKG